MNRRLIHIIWATALGILLPGLSLFGQDFVNLKGGTNLYLNNNAIFYVNGSLRNESTITGNSSRLTVMGDYTNVGVHNASSSTFSVGGDFINNSTFNLGTATIALVGPSSQTITGSQEFDFEELVINKTGGVAYTDWELHINQYLRIVSKTLLDIGSNDIVIEENAKLYSDFSDAQYFHKTKHIVSSQSSPSSTTGYLVRKIAAGTPPAPDGLPLVFPIGSSEAFSFAQIRFLEGGATFGASAELKVLPVPGEHPNVIAHDRSLLKYWRVDATDISINTEGVTLQFKYDTTMSGGTEIEVPASSSEGNYIPLLFQSGQWITNTGTGTNVNTTTNLILNEYCPLTGSSIDGEWLAGEPEAAIAIFYSIADGPFNQASTWSNVNYGGPAASIIPNSSSDQVFIGDGKTVHLEANTPYIQKVTVQTTGRLDCYNSTTNTSYYVQGQDFEIEDGGTLGVGSSVGISSLIGPTPNSGSVRTDQTRIFGDGCTYVYMSNSNQETGDGIPTEGIHTLICDKPAGTLTLSDNISIKNTFSIYQGTVDDDSKTIDGETASRTFTMSGGTFIIRDRFPINYVPPTFTAGTIRFDGSSDLTVPSSGSATSNLGGVEQYYNLTIDGGRGMIAAVTFAPQGEVRIGGQLTLPVTFNTFATKRFLVSGSTIVFNGDGDQDIPRRCATTAGDFYELSYYNLKIAGTGTKRLIHEDHIILNDFTLEGGTFSLNNFDLEVRGNWLVEGGTFDHTNDQVRFYVPAETVVKTITSGGESFYDVVIGNAASPARGEVRFIDDMLIEDDLIIDDATSIFSTISSTLTLIDDWENYGTFNPGTGAVVFGGTGANQPLYCDGTETFYDLKIDNPNNVQLDWGTDIEVAGSLEFSQGNIDARTNGRTVTAFGDIYRPGTGHVDGNLSYQVPEDATGYIFLPVGDRTTYAPVGMQFKGVGGSEGLINILLNEPHTIGLPADMSATRYVDLQWEITEPTGTSFALGARTYDLGLAFNNPADFNSGSEEPLLFETFVNDGAWNTTNIGQRLTTATASLDNTLFGTFMVGEPAVFNLYSIAEDGDWSDLNTWSTEGYGGDNIPAGFTLSGDHNYHIGDGKSVTLDGDFTINSGRSVTVQKGGTSGEPGALICGTNVLDGAGSFVFQEGAILAIADPDGITASAAAGNIQTTTRTYNDGNHDAGKFIYNSEDDDQVTGDGLPAQVSTLQIAVGSHTVTLSNDIAISDTFNIKTGTFDVSAANNYSMEIGGYWKNTGDFTERNATVTFNGADDQLLRNSNDETFYDLVIDKAGGALVLDAPSTDLIVSNSLALTSGYIDSRENLRNVTILNGASVSRIAGHVDGELRKYIATGATGSDIEFEVGNDVDYTPLSLSIAGSGGTAGYMSVNSNLGPHIFFSHVSNDIDPAANVERYWTIAEVDAMDLDSRTMDITVQFLNPDDIRGGSNPSNYVMRLWDNVLWNNITNGVRTATTTEGLSISQFGDIMVGETGSLNTYYSRASGPWNSNSTWSTVAFGGPAATSYPDDNSDIAHVGGGHEVTLDQSRSIRCVTVEENGGIGAIMFGSNVLSGEQFVLKDGGKIGVGATDGIQTLAASGNVQTNIRNFNPGTHNNGHYVYNGTANQNTGDALPAAIASLEINNTGGTVTLESAVEISGDITFTDGALTADLPANDITLAGSWFNNSAANAYDANGNEVLLTGETSNTIGGSFGTVFYDLTINKPSAEISLEADMEAEHDISFSDDARVILNNNNVSLGPTGNIAGGPFSAQRMFVSDGSASSGSFTIQYSGSGQHDVTVPIGVGNVYNEAQLNVNATYAGGANAVLQLRSGAHPLVLGSDVLQKYWSVSTSGISNLQTGTNLSFAYEASDVAGDQSDYIPARNTSGVWEVNLGTSRVAYPSPIVVMGYTDALDGDWTAATPPSLMGGRVFYSRNSYDWDQADCWSNISHSGTPSAYMPGTFESDTVYIDAGHTVDFNQSNLSIGYMRIGGGEGGNGLLRMQRGSNKLLEITGDLDVESDGYIDETGSGSRRDTISLGGSLKNDNTNWDAVDFRIGDYQYTILRFFGNSSSTISGEGDYRLSGVHISKDGRQDTVVNISESFTSALNSAVNGGSQGDRHFVLNKGIYRHDNVGSTYLDRDNGVGFFMGVNSGFDFRQGTCRLSDDVQTNTNTSWLVQGTAQVFIGDDNDDDFYYQAGTDFTMTGGEMSTVASFSAVDDNAYVNFIMSGGTLRVVTNDFGNRNDNDIGFDVKNASSTYTQSGGTIVITSYSYNKDYEVNAGTLSVTGGELQTGEVGSFLGGGASIGVGNNMPTIWDLVVKFTRSSWTAYRSFIVATPMLYVLNDVKIEDDGCFDLNTNSVTLGGSFINKGLFTPDGIAWNSAPNTYELIFNGPNSATISIEEPVVRTPNHNIFQNESFYDIILEKSSGTITLGDMANSDMIVRNNLKFEPENVAAINARENNRKVEIDYQATGDNAEVQKVGDGFVDGTLRKHINSGASITTFEIGYGDDYTPLRFSPLGSGGTTGPIDAIAYGYDPANIASNGLNLDLDRNVQRYWTVSDPGSFDLGGRTFDLSLYYLDTDMRNGANWTVFNQYYASVTPYTIPTVAERTEDFIRSTGNTDLGDYAVGEIVGYDYYSIADGEWADNTTWSVSGYGGGVAPVGFYPMNVNDKAYIGDGHKVTLSEDVLIRSVIIEKDAGASTLPGKLYVKEDGWIEGEGFTLEESTTFSTEHPNGIVDSNMTGSVRTSIRSYGIAHYLYQGVQGDQSTGNGLPDTVISLTINNIAPFGFNRVTLTEQVNILQDFSIFNGMFDTGSKFMSLAGNFILYNNMDSETKNEEVFVPKQGTFEFTGSGEQALEVNEDNDIEFYRLFIKKPASRIVMGGSIGMANIFVGNTLRFQADNIGYLSTRDYNRKVIIDNENGAVAERLGLGHVDGTVEMHIDAGTTDERYETGYLAEYTPVSASFTGSDGVAGPIDVIVNELTAANDAVTTRQIDLDKSTGKYWSVLGQTTFDMGTRLVNLHFEFPTDNLDDFDYTNSIVKRRSVPVEVPEWTGRGGSVLSWNDAVVSVEISDPARYWPGLGHFYIGEMASRIFYSTGSGEWDDPTIWSFEGHSGAHIEGEFPNKDWNAGIDELEVRDEIYIGDGDVVVLNTLPEVASIIIEGSGTLVIPDDNDYGSPRYLSGSSFGTTHFEIQDGGQLTVKSASGIESGTSDGIVRFDNSSRTYSTGSNFEFSGAYDQEFGGLFPTSVGNITINTDNNSRLVSGPAGDLTLSGNLNILTGEMRPTDASLNLSIGGDLTVNGILDMTKDPLGVDIEATLLFSGPGSQDQTVSGTGTIDIANLTMDRGAGTGGFVELQKSLTVENVLDMQNGTNANSQLLLLADGVDLTIADDDPNAILDASSTRFIVTSSNTGTSGTEGRLIREISQPQGTPYLYPVGNYVTETGQVYYAPALFTPDASGSDGSIALRTTRGSGVSYNHSGHSTISPHFLMRYWNISDVTTTVSGQWRFDYNDADIFGTESNITRISRFNPGNEDPTGSWTAVEGTITRSSNYFETPASYSAADFEGDFTIANANNFRRFFYSRQSGNWNDPNTWTFMSSHAGPSAGDIPRFVDDNVIIGGGNYSLSEPNHVVTISEDPGTLGEIRLGTDATNTGTLDCSNFVVKGDLFEIGNRSTLIVGSPDGIFEVAATGNVQTDSRIFNDQAIYQYSGIPDADQTIGDGLPNNVFGFVASHQNVACEHSIIMDRNIKVSGFFQVSQGRIDAGSNFEVQNVASPLSAGQCIIGSSIGGTFAFGGARIMDGISSTSVTKFFTLGLGYDFNINGTVELYGVQVLTPSPNEGVGYGNVAVTINGDVQAISPVLIRGNFSILDNGEINNMNNIQVLRHVINESRIENNGVLEIGD